MRGLVAGGETPQDALELAAALLPGADPVGRALCCVHDPVTGALDWGRTDGHPAPLLRHEGVVLPLNHGGPGEHLLPGDLLLLHTTGTGHDNSTDLLQALPLPWTGTSTPTPVPVSRPTRSPTPPDRPRTGSAERHG